MKEPVLVVGLGNIGDKYAHTRHNIGFLAVDFFAGKQGWRFKAAPFRAEWCKEKLEEREVCLIKPHTLMNSSGEAVSMAVRFFEMEISPENLVVISDDLDLPFGSLRIRIKGGHGGHRGLASIIEQIGKEQFTRLRMGIAGTERKDATDFVLSVFSSKEAKELPSVLERASQALDLLIKRRIGEAMQSFNAKIE